jgi:predicted DNA-binding transcriptional regulator AlpA
MGDQLLRIPEVARRLGIDGTDVYRLIERGALDAGKGADGLVHVRESALESYVQENTAASS